jgi:phosphate transport system substrate-binding protein
MATGLLAVASAPAGASPSMNSTGSSFAGPAIQSWVAQSGELYGLNINWQVSSSVFGLQNFSQNQVDFAASDIPYSANQVQPFPSQPYQYMPDVAGGLAFMFHLTGVDGQQINNLTLNPPLIDKIFLGEITKWNDGAIAAANPQLAGDLPNETIHAVYRADGSGENYLLSDYLLHQDGGNFSNAQNVFNSGNPGQPNAIWPTPQSNVNVSSPSFSAAYPAWTANDPVSETGSDNAANYVASLGSEGSITYLETAYAREHHFPVASLVNASGAAVQPTSLNVAVALEKAILHQDLTQDLTNVYTNNLPQAYPLSAYSYFVSPCSPNLATNGGICAADPGGGPSPFPSAKGFALGQFVSYVACAGQESMAALGYSPLPPNLVEEDFEAVSRLNGGQRPPPPTANTCKNPYVDGEIPLPGEPVIYSNGGTPITVPGVTTTTAGNGGGAGSHGSSSAGKGGSGSSGSAKTYPKGVSTAGLSAKQIAEGYVYVNGHLAKSAASIPEGQKILNYHNLVAAVDPLAGGKLLLYLGWLLAALAVLVAPPLIVMTRRKRAAAVPAEEPSPTRGEP